MALFAASRPEDPHGLVQTGVFQIHLHLREDYDVMEPVIKANGETFLLCVSLAENIKAGLWKMVITNKSFYKYEMQAALDAPRKRKDLMDIHSVEVDDKHPQGFIVRSYKSKAKMGFSSLLGRIGKTMEFEQFLQVRKWKAKSATESEQIVWVLNRALRNRWQEAFETKLMPQPEIYVRHSWVIKSGSLSSKSQERVLVFSTHWLYNVECQHNPFTIKDCKWAYPISSITSIVLDQDDTFCLNFDKTKRLKMLDNAHSFEKEKVNAAHTFKVADKECRDVFVKELARVFKEATGDSATVQRKRTVKAVMHKSPQDSDVGVIVLNSEMLVKFTKAGKSSHKKFFALYSNGCIKWGDQEMTSGKYPYSEQVTGFVIGETDIRHKELTLAQQKCFFTLHTSGKSLFLMAPSAESLHAWNTLVDGLLSIKRIRRNRMGSVTSLDLVAELSSGFIKYTKGGSSKHQKYMQLYRSGIITWGDDGKKYKFSETIQGVSRSYACLNKKVQGLMTPECAERFLVVNTSGKPLMLLAPSKEVGDRWFTRIEEMSQNL